MRFPWLVTWVLFTLPHAGAATPAGSDVSATLDDQSPAAVTPAPALPTAETASETDDGWPRDISDGGNQVTIYQPEVESWKDNRLVERAAVSVRTRSAAQPIYGVAWISARTEVDKASHLVTLEDIEITRASFPSAPGQKDAYLALLKKHSPSLVKTIALDRLQASLSITQAEEKHAAPEFKNNAPEILYRQNPAILVLVDGAPALRETGTKDFLRVINTRSLLVLNQASGTYFIYLGDRWMSAKDLKGPWSAAENPPAALEPIKKAAADQNQADLLNEPGSPLLEDLQKGVTPEILVSTKPAELIQTSGKPQLQPISGTKLLYVNNSSDSIFVDEADQKYYILLSGRWYRASALDGQWSYVASKSLPADFAKIPENHPKGEVLTSVAHTKQAQEAAISNEIPQTATVDRNQASLNVGYDGPPDFKPVEGTPLRYAPNSPTPVIEVDAHSYYAVQNGIWFEATSATGPWVVATRVPSVIYSIPPSSPLYYVTFVKVYGSTPEVVYVGYTPGYLGSYVNPDGVVVFGTGYPYSPWIGSYWYGAPVTFGFGLFWGPWFGWGFHSGFYGGYFAGAPYHPWWGPWRGRMVVRDFHLNRLNVYQHWGRATVRNDWNRGGFGGRPGPGAGYRPGGRPNNVYSSSNGNVYRHSGNGWQSYQSHGWQRAGNAAGRAELDRNRNARAAGEQHWNSYRSHGTPATGNLGGGYGGGGSGRRRASAGGGGGRR